MKQLFALVFFLLISMQHEAQIMAGLSSPVPAVNKTDVKVKKGKAYKNAYVNNVSSAVAGDFASRFGENNVNWFVDNKEVTGYFSDNGISHTVYYENERYLKTRSVYDSSKLSVLVRDFLEQELGKTYKINLVTEVKREEGSIYEISLSNDKKILVVTLEHANGHIRPSLVEKKWMTRG
jgi:hypothetical protein